MDTGLRPGGADEVGIDPQRLTRARDLCAQWVAEGHTPTLSVCVARRGVIVLHEAFGVLGPDSDSPCLTRDALFPVASITKPVTATLVMQLVEDGVLGLNRPAVDYIPELTGEGVEDILVHHLLTHTSGYALISDPSMVEHAARRVEGGLQLPPCPQNQHPDIHRRLCLFWDAPRLTPAGQVMNYSDLNFHLLGEIVRRLSGCCLEDLARKRIFAPLGMNSSFLEVPAAESHRVVQRAMGLPLTNAQDPRLHLGSRVSQEIPSAAGGLYTTPRDLAAFGQAFLENGGQGDARILSRAAVEAMACDQIPGLRARFFGKQGERASCGYGWLVSSPVKWKYYEGSLRTLGTISHPGAGGSCVWIDRQRELVGVYCEVTTRVTEDFSHRWNFDLFQNVITAAVDD
jgi:CubicO group peptidase (beta-lactamase class C family)